MTEYEKAVAELGVPFLEGPWGGYDYFGVEVLRTPEENPRRRLCRKFSFAIPNDEALTRLASRGPLLEVGAGSGYWAWELRNRGVDVVATDPHPGRTRGGVYYFSKLWTEVERLPADEAVRKYPGRTLFLCWPSLGEDWAEKALLEYRGAVLCYAGEWGGGCCAADGFFELLDAGWATLETVEIPQWYGVHDALWFLGRKGTL